MVLDSPRVAIAVDEVDQEEEVEEGTATLLAAEHPLPQLATATALLSPLNSKVTIPTVATSSSVALLRTAVCPLTARLRVTAASLKRREVIVPRLSLSSMEDISLDPRRATVRPLRDTADHRRAMALLPLREVGMEDEE